MKIVHEGKDIHKGTVEMVFGIPYDEITSEQRDIGKTTNFSLVYGVGNASFAKALGHSVDEQKLRQGTSYLYEKFKAWDLPPYSDKVNEFEAMHGVSDPSILDGIVYFFTKEVQEALKHAVDTKNKYFNQFPGIKQFLKDCKNAGSRRGYVATWAGRRRHFKNPARESYKAPNAVIQGGCGDILKTKLAELMIFLEPYKTKLVNNVHDEVCVMVHKTELDLIPQVKAILEDLPFRVPITCGSDFAYRWGEKKEFTTVEELKKELGL